MGVQFGWVAMMLTPPYLKGLSTGMVAAMPIVSFGDPVSSSGSMDVDYFAGDARWR